MKADTIRAIAVLSLIVLIIVLATMFVCNRAKGQVAGDANADDKYGMGDIVYGINYIFGGGPAPRFADETLVLKWASPGATSGLSYADRYRVIRRPYGSEFFDTLFEFPAPDVNGGDTVWITVNLPVDGIAREYQVRYHSRYIEQQDSMYTIPGLVIARVGKSWRKE